MNCGILSYVVRKWNGFCLVILDIFYFFGWLDFFRSGGFWGFWFKVRVLLSVNVVFNDEDDFIWVGFREGGGGSVDFVKVLIVLF